MLNLSFLLSGMWTNISQRSIRFSVHSSGWLLKLIATAMAFDRPLEADRVDDLNLFSTFVRAPIIGTIMWILGGERAKKEEEKLQRQQVVSTLSEGTNDANDTVPPPAIKRSKFSSKQPMKSALKGAAPSLVGSEVSDVGECAAAMDGMVIDAQSFSSLKKNRKELSWSDEVSGQELCVTIGGDEVSKNVAQSVDGYRYTFVLFESNGVLGSFLFFSWPTISLSLLIRLPASLLISLLFVEPSMVVCCYDWNPLVYMFGQLARTRVSVLFVSQWYLSGLLRTLTRHFEGSRERESTSHLLPVSPVTFFDNPINKAAVHD
jgi:hypothetical protein